MEEFFTKDMTECRLKNQFSELFKNRIFIGESSFFELECCSDDAGGRPPITPFFRIVLQYFF